MSELFMECEEEELEPWQKQIPEVNLLDDDDDDEPIFVGELTNTQRNSKPNPTPLKTNDAGLQGLQTLSTQSTRGPVPIMVPSNILGKGANSATSTLTTITPQPVIINNQGFIVTQPQLTNTELIASLGKQYPPGTSFTIVQAGQQHILQQMAPTKVSGVVHRPQVQQINNNIVTLSNVQSPAIFSTASNQLQFNQSNLQPVQLFSVPVEDQSSLKRRLVPQQHDELLLKKTKVDIKTPKVNDSMENGLYMKNCPKCNIEFRQHEDMKSHRMICCASLMGSPSVQNTDSPTAVKRIMLLSDFYYGRFDGEQLNQQVTKSTNTFKCKSCLKVLKNNIKFMNHMKHHLELEKQNSESWDSHTTCQHCYRQYLTPFQLQCHIENAHSTSESATNCKICELAFESEQVLLEHMKDNHKPGEMPYVCQVCNFRSSFFRDVDVHFRTVHDNTKDLLCPFCLRVLKSGHVYMQHFMKHQRKGIHRCGKCRLNFLTNKERIDHKINFHKTFRKPPPLEGLPPGSKVTIRASRTGNFPSTQTPLNQTGFSATAEMPSSKHLAKAQCNIPKSKLHIFSRGQDKSKKKERHVSLSNLVLQKLRVDGGHYTCIECDTKIDDFFSHYPMTSSCGACTYRTSCKVSIGNHMIRFHSSITKGRFWRMASRKRTSPLNFTLVCLNCDLLVDATKCDLMSKHLVERPRHVCRYIQDRDIHVEDLGVLNFDEPTKDLANITSAPAESPKEVDMKPPESIEPGAPLVEGNNVAPDKEIPAQRPSPSHDQDMGVTETSIERSSTNEFEKSTQRSPPPPEEDMEATETYIEISPEKAFEQSPQRSPPPPDQDIGATETSIERSSEKAFEESSQRSPPPPDQEMGATDTPIERSPEKAFEDSSQPSLSSSLACTLDQDILDVSLDDTMSAGVREKADALIEPLTSPASDHEMS